MIDQYHVVQSLPPRQILERSDLFAQMFLGTVRSFEELGEVSVQYIVNQGGLSRSGHSGYGN